MDAFGRPDAPPSAEPGWYPDPGGSGSHRYWDGTRWTDALSSAIPPAGPQNARDDSRNFALAAHLSALLCLFIGFPFVGPLVVYLVKKDDPFVRRQAAEALNFNLSIMLYAAVLAIAGLLLLIVLVGILVWLLLIPLGIFWIVMVCIAASKAGQGADYRYPLTIRFVT
ncbi:MAG TPA: DUF4870 domain-containing protein [Solirubrobacteraceae bacterium]|nr:DUF4870 domain-containing protein [Solirubrobacteraceae bacterium]